MPALAHDEDDPAIAMTMTAIAAIAQHTKMQPGQGTMRCPVCQGRLHYAVSYARAAAAMCETPGCVRFLS